MKDILYINLLLLSISLLSCVDNSEQIDFLLNLNADDSFVYEYTEQINTSIVKSTTKKTAQFDVEEIYDDRYRMKFQLIKYFHEGDIDGDKDFYSSDHENENPSVDQLPYHTAIDSTLYFTIDKKGYILETMKTQSGNSIPSFAFPLDVVMPKIPKGKVTVGTSWEKTEEMAISVLSDVVTTYTITKITDDYIEIEELRKIPSILTLKEREVKGVLKLDRATGLLINYRKNNKLQMGGTMLMTCKPVN